jgi:predicted glycosyltransferase
MHVLFYLGHPAHFHLFKNLIKELKRRNHKISILIKKKDVLEKLLIEESFYYKNILPEGRKDDKISVGLGLLKRDYRMFFYCLKNRPNLMVGTSPEITHVGKLLNIYSVVVNEDDAEQVPFFAKMAYPLATNILVPLSCSTGKWKEKTIFYDGYHELAYLHPKYFTPSFEKIKELFKGGDSRFFILRFAKLSAHHDTGKTGITTEVAQKIIEKLKPFGEIYITSERELEPQFEKYRIPINPRDMHDALFFTDLFIGDSQTMAAEAAVLGTPSIRFNDFVGKLGYLEELEVKYGLTYGIKTNEPDKLFNKIDELVSIKSLKNEFNKRKQKMLSDKIDVTEFMLWLFENYPNSLKIIEKDAEYQYNFKFSNEDNLLKSKSI